MDFEQLKTDKRITKILNDKGYTIPTTIQAETYPLAANGHDVVGVSKTGSGKTLAFILPTINQFLLSEKPFHTLIVTPTREIAMQIAQFLSYFDSLGIRYATLVGGEPFTPQVELLNKHPHVVIGTPGRIAKHIQKTKNFKIESIRKLVLDEADRFFEQDFTADLDLIAARLARRNQTLMFTATLTEKVKQLSGIFMKAPRIVGRDEKYEGVETLHDFYSLIPEKYKLAVLCNYLSAERDGSTLVFVGMCVTAQKVALLLERLGVSCACLYGSMAQDKRAEVIQSFKNQEFSILISTDLGSRGLDIPHVDTVINYDMPNTARDYMHRVGRTARAGNVGTAVTFTTQYDAVKLQKLEYVLKRKLNEKKLELFHNSESIADVYELVCSSFNEGRSFKKRR